MLALPTAESGDLLRGCCEAEAAVAVGLVLAVRVHGAGGLVDGLVDDVVLQLIWRQFFTPSISLRQG